MGLLQAAGACSVPLSAAPLQRLASQPRRRWFNAASRLPVRSRRGPLRCRAHGSHSHSHECHSHAHSHSHSHDHDHTCASHSAECDSGAFSCGHDHSHAPNPANPAHRLLKAVFDATRLTAAAAWLESSLAVTVGKVALFLLAAASAGWAASGWAVNAAHAELARQLSTAATAGVYLLAGLPAAVELSYDLSSGRVDTHVLMNLAVLGTLVTGHALEGALLLVLFQTSHALEHLLTDKAQGNLAALYETMPKEATVVEVRADGSPELATARRVRAADVAVGDCLLVKPGEQVPLDGAIVHGRAMVSSEHITGESLPVLRRAGDDVAAGSLNRDGLLVVRVLRLAEESTPARIAKLTLDAQAKRPQLRSWLDEFGELYSKAVVAASAALLVALLLSGVPLLGAAGQRGAFYRAMGLLTVASPCALVMVPLAYVSAIAAIASRGILVKGGRVLDALAGCSTVAFDKTGTLTTGSLSCTSMRPLAVRSSSSSTGKSRASSGSRGGVSTASVLGLPPKEAAAAKRAALSIAVALSLRSSHPVSDAVVWMGQQAGLDGSWEDVRDFELVPGGGVRALVVSSSSSSGSPSSSTGSSSTSGAAQQWQAAFGSAEFVGGLLSEAEAEAVRKLAAGQGTSGVLSVLVLEPAAAAIQQASSSSEAASSRLASGSSNGSHSADVGAGSSSSSNGSSSSHEPSSSPAAGQRSVWVLAFEDSVRTQSAAAVRQLQTGSWTGKASQASRLSVTMLTGDNAASAARVARRLGIAAVKAGLSPEQKLQHVQELSGHSSSSSSSEGRNAAPAARRSSRRGAGSSRRGVGVIMVGDGINDAPALAAADVGVAIASTATAAASLAADVIVVNGSGIAAVPLLLKIAQATQAVIRQNLALAAGSILALSLPTVLGWVPLWFAVMLHEGSTLLVALNSLRLLRFGAAPRQWMRQERPGAQLPAGQGTEHEGAPRQQASASAASGGVSDGEHGAAATVAAAPPAAA